MNRQIRFAARGVVVVLGLVFCANTAGAQVTYLDADTGNQPGSTNTTNADGSPFMPPMSTTGAPADNQFWERTGYANDGDILASNGGSDSPMMRTTISGLVPNASYDVFVYYWWADSFGNGEWDISAGLTLASVVGYLYTDGSPISNPATHFTNTVMIAEGNRDMYELSLGTTTASVTGTIDFYIDDYPGNDDRTWYDGVGYLMLGGPGTPYCFGDGNGTLCPCANNNNGAQAGCDWGDPGFPGGGALEATGSSSIAANDTLLLATGISNNFGIFFGAANQVNGGNGNPLNDGLRCAGGSLVRLIPPTMATGNQMTLSMPVQTLDTGAAAGVTRRYQYWFRTPAGPCGQQANLTNGYEIVWLP